MSFTDKIGDRARQVIPMVGVALEGEPMTPDETKTGTAPATNQAATPTQPPKASNPRRCEEIRRTRQGNS
jgi:hypothetical protein